jgi:hypothetical protein
MVVVLGSTMGIEYRFAVLSFLNFIVRPPNRLSLFGSQRSLDMSEEEQDMSRPEKLREKWNRTVVRIRAKSEQQQPRVSLTMVFPILAASSRLHLHVGAAMILLAILVIINIAFPTFFEFEDVGQIFSGSQKKNHNNTVIFPIIPVLALDPPVIVERASLSCNWSPKNNTECVTLLSSRMNASSFGRWLILGDSTMFQLVQNSPLKRILVDHSIAQINKACPMEFSCTKRRGSRCNLNGVFGVPYRPDRQWYPPNLTLGEGPVKFGLMNSYCHDCDGCNTDLVACTKLNFNNNQTCPESTLKTLNYGGYISMEFARDVEIQSPKFGTSQENIALLFLNSTKWNQDLILSAFGPTACIIGTGIHDIAVPNITLSRYIDNVKWYLRLLHPTCGHFIWVANTAPKASTEHLYPQGFNRTLEWNTAVRFMLESTTDFMHKSSFVDVYNASISFPHADNIHLLSTWYRALGSTFASLITL